MSSGPIGSSPALHTGPLSRPAVRRMIETPGALVAGHDRALQWRGAAPARQQRGMHVQDLVFGEQRILDQRPEGAHDHRRRPGRPSAVAMMCPAASGSLTRSGCSSAEPEPPRRHPPPAGCAGAGPRPAGAVGPRHDQRRAVALLRSQPLEHRGGKRRGAQIDDAQSDADPSCSGGARASAAPRASRASPPCAPRGVCDRGSEPRRGDRSRAGSPAPRAPRPRSRAPRRRRRCRARAARAARSTSTCTPGRLRHPSSAISSSSLCPLDLGVHEHRQRVVDIRFVHEQAVQHTELRRRQPDAERVVHQLAHPLRLALQSRIEALDRQRDRRAAPDRRTCAPGAARRRAWLASRDRALRPSGASPSALDLDVIANREASPVRLVLVCLACVLRP